jgi:hypothetical protein
MATKKATGKAAKKESTTAKLAREYEKVNLSFLPTNI